jgi:hypothetical protein
MERIGCGYGTVDQGYLSPFGTRHKAASLETNGSENWLCHKQLKPRKLERHIYAISSHDRLVHQRIGYASLWRLSSWYYHYS